MDTYGIIDPVELARIREVNETQVNYEDLKSAMIEQINKQWKSNNEIIGSFRNKYYNFDYTITTSYNATGDRTLTFLHTGSSLHDYRWVDIKNWLNTRL
tara:strand:+ start:216 stop:512 length:297 start_codon:yes stop_codon:yes gene_type:complete